MKESIGAGAAHNGRPVLLRPAMATPCFYMRKFQLYYTLGVIQLKNTGVLHLARSNVIIVTSLHIFLLYMSVRNLSKSAFSEGRVTLSTNF